jgi:hypothetical protein
VENIRETLISNVYSRRRRPYSNNASNYLNNKSRKNNNEEFNIRETYEKSLSLLSLKDTHREEAKVRERV